MDTMSLIKSSNFRGCWRDCCLGHPDGPPKFTSSWRFRQQFHLSWVKEYNYCLIDTLSIICSSKTITISSDIDLSEETIYLRFVSIGSWLALGGVFLQAGLLETVALLSQSVADGAHYASLVEDHEMCKIFRWNDFVSFANENRNFRRKIPQNKPKHFKIWVWNLDLWRTWRNLKFFNILTWKLTGSVATLQHVHETFRWYATLLSTGQCLSSLSTAFHRTNIEELFFNIYLISI